MRKIDFEKGEKIQADFRKAERDEFIDIYGFHHKVLDPKEKKIYYGVSVNDFEESEIKQYMQMLTMMFKYSGRNGLIKLTYPVDQVFCGFRRIGIVCSMPYNKTVHFYHQMNNIFYEELVSEIADVITCYNLCLEMKFPVSVSHENVSFACVKNPKSPYPQIVLTPYAFINGFVKESVGEGNSVHLEFAPIFEYFHQEVEKIKGPGNYFMDIIEKLRNGEDIRESIMNHPFFNEFSQILDIPSFDLNDYEYVKPCGSGKFGSVSIMKRKSDGQLFAMKESSFESLEFLQKEAFTLKSMNHRNIVKFVGFTEADQYVSIPKEKSPTLPHGFLLMEFCANGNLDMVIRKYTQNNQYLNINLIKMIFGQICEACLYVHYEKRYIHRDLKLANIVIDSFKPIIQLKLCDFGFARSIDTEMGTLLATPLTCDIRILKRETYDDRADLFSIGCILYCLAHGQYPCGDCRDITQLVSKVTKRQIDLSIPQGRDPKFGEVFALVGHLMNLDNSNMTWDEFKSHSFVIECLNTVDELRKQYNL